MVCNLSQIILGHTKADGKNIYSYLRVFERASFPWRPGMESGKRGHDPFPAKWEDSFGTTCPGTTSQVRIYQVTVFCVRGDHLPNRVQKKYISWCLQFCSCYVLKCIIILFINSSNIPWVPVVCMAVCKVLHETTKMRVIVGAFRVPIVL